jgi:hypothetical protein
MFSEYINNPRKNSPILFRIDGYNIDNISLFINNCNDGINDGITASFDLKLWMNDFLNKYYKYIAYITICPRFEINGILFSCKTKELEEEELDEFFNYYRHRNLALLYVIKKISLETFKIIYEIRYIDITSKEDEREFKLVDILEREQ